MKRLAYTRWILLPFALMLLAGCGLFDSNDDPGNDDPDPIQSIRIDGRNVVYARAGSGDVPVIFEAGLGDGLESWDPIFEDVAEFSTAFAYSRPGYGDSGPATRPRTGDVVVDELRRLLRQVGLEPPYVLAGHSIGGMYMELYAKTYPDEVAALVLVDSRHESVTRRCIEQFSEAQCVIPEAILNTFPAHERAEYAATSALERQIREAGPLGDIPLVVLTAGKPDVDGDVDFGLWQETQRALAAQSPTSTHVIAEESRHYIHDDQPDLVLQHLRNVVNKTQR